MGRKRDAPQARNHAVVFVAKANREKDWILNHPHLDPGISKKPSRVVALQEVGIPLEIVLVIPGRLAPEPDPFGLQPRILQHRTHFLHTRFEGLEELEGVAFSTKFLDLGPVGNGLYRDIQMLFVDQAGGKFGEFGDIRFVELDFVVTETDRFDLTRSLDIRLQPGLPRVFGVEDVAKFADQPAAATGGAQAIYVVQTHVFVDRLAVAHFLLLEGRKPLEHRVLFAHCE